jgi:hypothetical protein
MKNVVRRRGSHVRPRMSRKEFATFPTRDAFRPLVAFRTKIRILEIIRILLTCLSQLRSESVIHRTVLTPIHVLIGDEVCGRIDFRPWNLVDRRELTKSPSFESAGHNIDQSTRPLYRGTIQRYHINQGSAGVTKYSRLSRISYYISHHCSIQ